MDSYFLQLIMINLHGYWAICEIQFRLKDDYGYVSGGSYFPDVDFDVWQKTWWCYQDGPPTSYWLNQFYLYKRNDHGGSYAELDIEVWEIDFANADDYVGIIRDISVIDGGSYSAGGGLDIDIRCCGISQSERLPLQAPSWICNYEQ